MSIEPVLSIRDALKLLIKAADRYVHNRNWGRNSLLEAIAAARAALAEPVGECPGCEGTPAASNSPCAVCGRPAALAEPVREGPAAWLYKGDPDFDGTTWRDNWRVTTDEQVARFKARPDEPIPLFRRPAAPPAPEVGEVQRDEVLQAVAEALGNAYDCQRVWAAWSVGTMGQDDFALVAEAPDRVAEIADAAIAAMRPAAPPAPEVGELGELVLSLRETAARLDDDWYHASARIMRSAATLLQQLSAPAPVVVPVPVAVSERLPEPNTKVLAYYFNSLGKGRTICAVWVPAKSQSEDLWDDDDFTEYDEESGNRYWPEGWYEQIENWDDFGSVRVNEGEVVYWQPLPKWPAHAIPLPQAGEGEG